EIGFGSYGSHREVIDVSQPLIDDVLAVRFIAMNDESEYRQEHTFNDDRRYYGAIRWQPKLADSIFTQIDVRGGAAKSMPTDPFPRRRPTSPQTGGRSGSASCTSRC